MDLDVSKLKPHEIQAYYEIVNDCILWAEAFLMNPDNGQPLQVNYVQRQILGSKSKKTVIRVHRRAGKSYALTIFALWYALTHESAQVLIICPDQAKVHALFNNIDEFLRVSPLLKDCLAESTKTPALRKFKNGSTISGFTAGSRSKAGAETLRGQTADVVIIDEAAFLNKSDWPAIEPIMQGDATRPNVISFVSSTPTAERNRYWEFCTKNQDPVPKSLKWNRIHVQVTDNPDYDADRIAEIRAQVDDFTWKQEWMALFPDIGEGVYKRSYIDRAKRDYEYYNPASSGFSLAPAIRTMGVDWDKYNGTGPNIIVLELDRDHGVYKAVYHEEIEPSHYCLTLATQRIITLNAIFSPQYIYVDRGYGENQVEYLHLYGEQHPETGLSTKVKGISFSDTVEVLDPATRERVKKKIKPVMVNLTVKWMEDNRFTYPKSHSKFTEQLQDFKVIGITDNNIRYSQENEHIIDAFCLAAYAMHSNFADPFAFKPASEIYLLPVPEVVTARTHDANGRPLAFGIVKEVPTIRNDFGKRKIPPRVGRTLGPNQSAGIRKGF